MHTYDASSFLHAWDNYPIEHFPPLWEWLGEQISERLFTIPNVAFEEVDRKSPECGQWLKDQEIERLSLTNEIIQQAVGIKHLLGISEDNYHPKGVGENDLFIIATAKLNGCVLVSDEAVQRRIPDIPGKYRIPAVCRMPEVNVTCVPFIDVIRQSDAVFSKQRQP